MLRLPTKVRFSMSHLTVSPLIKGQFSQPWDKREPYDTDIRVPLLIRGPGLFPKFVSRIPVQTADLAPTILKMAHLSVPAYMDGKSILHALKREQNGALPEWQKNIFIEYHGEGNDDTNDPTCSLPHDNTLAQCTRENWCKCQDSRNNTYNCIRRLSTSEDFLFCNFKDDENFVEAYDLRFDRYQLTNIYKYMKKNDTTFYHTLINNYLKCHGKKCRNL